LPTVSDNIHQPGIWLGYAHSFADYSWFTHYVNRLEQVSLEDVLRVARHYLDPTTV
jgi:predicted Zn-dependent peptidase